MESFEHRELEPTVADNFRIMVTRIHQARGLSGLAQRKAARKESILYASAILNASEQERRRLAEPFRLLAAAEPETAISAYKTLLAARILRAGVVRSILELPKRGPIIPK